MEIFPANGVEIAFTAQGEGDPVLLIHGFASNVQTNWAGTGWMSFLAGHGFRAIAFDNRGHGQSQKLYSQDAYSGPIMAGDARLLLDHLGIARADVIGYSMGARIAAFLALASPDRVRSAVLAGVGANLIQGSGDPEPIARALLADGVPAPGDSEARAFRLFADQTRSDRRALAACIMGSRHRIPADSLCALRVPVLVVAGTLDTVAGPARPLAEAIPGAQVLDVPRRDHMKTVGDPAFKEGVLEFLRQRP